MTTANEGQGDAAVTCPKCGSTQVHAEKRGWDLSTGFLGSSKTYITCMQCGNRFRPADAPSYSASAEGKHDTRVEWVVLALIVIGCFLLALLTRGCSARGR